MLSPRQAVLSMHSYHPPLAGRDGLRLDFNENTDACSPRVLERLRSMSPDQLVKYPEREPVETVVAEFLKVTRAEVLLANGVDEAIHLLCEAYLDRDDEAIIVVPTYSMYAIYAEATGAKVIRIPAGQNFSFPAGEVVKSITARTRLIAIANPNNPTGAVVGEHDLLQIARTAPDAALLVDEAYFEFYGQTMLRRMREVHNLFVARTFSKAYGMAGLRLGVLVGPQGQMSTLRRLSSPYNVNAVALACLPQALADQSYVEAYAAEVLEGRFRLQRMLESFGIQYWPSNANFVLLRVGTSREDASRFVHHMRQKRILVRDRSSDEGCEGCVRITVGRRQHVDDLLQALQSAFDELGISAGVVRP